MSVITFSGLASGLDTSSLISSLLDQERKLKIEPLSKQIEKLSTGNEAFSKLTELLNSIKDLASGFRVLNGGALQKLSSSSDESVLNAISESSAYNGSYSISVSQLAKNSTFSLSSSAGQYTSVSDYVSGGSAFSDTVDIVIGDLLHPEDSVSISISETTTLSQFVQDFNSQTSAATASLVNVGSQSQPDYQIVISSSKTGEDQGQLNVTVGATLQARLAFDQTQQSLAQNAIFSIEGISSQIERGSNSVSDVLDGITLNLKDVGSSRIEISADTTGTASKVKKLIDSINSSIKYIAENDTVTRDDSGKEVESIFGPLASTSIDDNFLTSLRSLISNASISGGLINSLADLGITTERDGTLKFDEEVFSEAVSTDPDSVSSILEGLAEDLAATDGLIAQYTQFNGIIDLSENTNLRLIEDLNKRISETEGQLSKYEESLLKRFANLEVVSGKLQSAQAALASLGS